MQQYYYESQLHSCSSFAYIFTFDVNKAPVYNYATYTLLWPTYFGQFYAYKEYKNVVLLKHKKFRISEFVKCVLLSLKTEA